MGGIYLYDENKKELELKFDRGYRPAFAEAVRILAYGEGLSGKAVELRRPLSISMEDYSTPKFVELLKGEKIESLVGIPLLAREKPVGAITLISRSVRLLNQREIHLLQSIGNQVGLALENAKLFSEVVRAKSEWETTFDSVTDLITIKDPDYRVLRANRAVFKRYGMKPQDVIGQRCYEVFYQREVPCEKCRVADTLHTKLLGWGERTSDLLNGVFEWGTFPVFDEAGEVAAVVETAREITEKKRLQIEKEVLGNVNRILASSLDVRQVIEAIHSELRKVLGSDGMTVLLFTGDGRKFRYFASDKTSQKLLPSEAYPTEGTPLERAVKAGCPLVASETEGNDFWLGETLFEKGIRSCLVFPLEFKGRLIGTMNFGSKERDHFSQDHVRFLQQVAGGFTISVDHSLLLSEIKSSEEKYRTVVEGAHDGVGVLGSDYKFSYVNERLAEMTGCSREELTGRDFRNLLDDESKQRVSDFYVRRQRGENVPSRYDFNLLRKDGGIRNIEISSTVVGGSNGNVNTICFLKDVTEKRKMEDELIQTEKLRALGEMASGVAHDFNNALAVILGNTQLLLYSVQDEKLIESLKTIEGVTKKSAQTVRRLQEFTKRKTPKERFKLDLRSVIRDSIEMTRPRWKDEAQGQGIPIEVVQHLQEIPSVEGNEAEFREVLTNLIFNAVEAMPDGGRIEIATYRKGEHACVRVADTGTGMTDEVKKKAFEPFFTTRPFTSRGLGLSMAYGIIERSGGEIELESKIGTGTTFTILLPVRSEEKEWGAPSLNDAGKKARILVIDDEETVRSILFKILSMENHQVTVAESGREGIRLFKEKEFDIVLTDLGMSDISGWEVCKAIKAISADFPVGMITGWEAEIDPAKLRDSGIDFVLPKPFQFHQVLQMVGKTIAREREVPTRSGL
jgi:PAS domain S-box-containing protein